MNELSQIADISKEFYNLTNEIALTIHKYKEISLREYKSYRYLANILSEYDFTVEKDNIKELPTYFKATYDTGKKGKHIAFLAEYDALPNIGHGCGHNLIAATSVTAGILLKNIIKTGSVSVIGTPAEEIGLGKAILIDKGIFNNIDYALMFHPGNTTRVRPSFVALSQVKVSFYGKSAHASSYPDKGINALTSVIELFNIINGYRQQLTNDYRISGIITNGGEAPNIIPDKASAKFNLRALDLEKLEELKDRFVKIIEGVSKSTFTKKRISFNKFDVLNMKFYPELEKLFIESLNEVWQDNDNKNIYANRWASSDIGNVSHLIPTIQPTVRITKTNTPLHTKEFAKSAKTDFAINRAHYTASALALTGLKLTNRGNSEK